MTIQRGAQYIEGRKKGNCIDCGENEPGRMRFVRKVAGTGAKPVSQMRSYSPARIAEELAECDLLCADCHVARQRRKPGVKIMKKLFAALATPVIKENETIDRLATQVQAMAEGWVQDPVNGTWSNPARLAASLAEREAELRAKYPPMSDEEWAKERQGLC
jgi:hypothetical protein